MARTQLVPLPVFGPFDRVAAEQHRSFADARHADAVAACSEHLGWVELAGDVTTARHLRYVAALSLRALGRHAESLQVAQDLADGADAAWEPLWRAKALAVAAQACLAMGRDGRALELLAEAVELVDRSGSPGVGHASAAMAVGMALEASGGYPAADAVLRAVLRRPVVAALDVLPELALLHAAWGAVGQLTGDDRSAHRHFATAASWAVRWRREALDGGEAGHAARALACEVYALRRLGLPDAARAAAAGADLRTLVPPHSLERELVELWSADECTAAGRYASARAHLSLAQRSATRAGRDIWAATAQVGHAEVDLAEHGSHPAADRWRRLSHALMRRLVEQSRAFASELGARRRVHQLTTETHRMSQAALRDPLTGLANRRALDEALTRAVREGAPLGACFVDVDSFKRVNDSWSHAVGDAVLQRVASMLSAACRSEDLVARYGGDEFVVLTSSDAAQAESLAQRVREAVAHHPWHEVADGLRVTVSVGMASSLPAAAVLAAADAALRAAKDAGRDRVVTADRP